MEKDFLINATISYQDTHFQNIPCKVHLPERIYDKPKITINATTKDVLPLTNFWHTSLIAEVRDFDDNIQKIIKTTELYILDAKTQHWGKGLSKTSIAYEPENLEVIKFIKMIPFLKKQI